ncbi:MAG: hypothetical protein KF908_15370 [Nitrosomonas sp.]|jgi:hypothetical protein|nr:hypothetical protein [Nitrosomonas sp.]
MCRHAVGDIWQQLIDTTIWPGWKFNECLFEPCSLLCYKATTEEKNYKMCVTSAFLEGDPEPWKSYSTSHPLLAAALKTSHEEVTKHAASSSDTALTSWCSNPILEHHDGNARTNCIGCHQHSNTFNPTTSRPTEFNDTFNKALDALYPQYGRSRARQNFPSDFSWGFQMEFKSQIACAKDSSQCSN